MVDLEKDPSTRLRIVLLLSRVVVKSGSNCFKTKIITTEGLYLRESSFNMTRGGMKILRGNP